MPCRYHYGTLVTSSGQIQYGDSPLLQSCLRGGDSGVLCAVCEL